MISTGPDPMGSELDQALDDGGAAVLCKFHHALTDGIGGIQIALNLFDLTAQAYTANTAIREPEAQNPTRLGRYLDVARYDLTGLGRLVSGTLLTAPKLLYEVVRQPVRTFSSAAELAASVYRTVRPVNATSSSPDERPNHGATSRRAGRSHATAEGGSPPRRRCHHDALVAGVAGGLRRYHEMHGVTVGDLHLTMPVSLRSGVTKSAATESP